MRVATNPTAGQLRDESQSGVVSWITCWSKGYNITVLQGLETNHIYWQVLNVQVPFYFKSIVDSMNVDFVAIGGTAYTIAGSVILACRSSFGIALSSSLVDLDGVDGLTRIGAALSQELRNAIFASVAQKAIRRVARNVFDHLLKLDLNFHLSRQTGGLTRAMDRGTKGISFILTSMVFHILPTALEISMVCGILVRLTSNY
jgi:ATP-binding cassette, subfamily B (MDR/TAP), member 7